MAALAPGMAAHQAPQRQVGAGTGAMALQRPQRIGRTGRGETAARTQPGTEQEPIALDQGDQGGADHGAARANSSCSSARTACRRASEVALMNRARSKPARNRTTCAATGNSDSRDWLTASIWRLMVLRVTALLAQRLGISAPTQGSRTANRAWDPLDPG